MHKTVLPCLAAFIFLMAPFWVHASHIQLERQLADDELLSMPGSITASLYTAPDAVDPVTVQTYYPGKWQLSGEGAARSLRLTLDSPGTEQQALWYELEADGLLLGEREAVLAVASGVTFAFENKLDMDGNTIANLEMPDAPGDGLDAANRAYVDNADISGNAATATQLAADGANCNAGQYPLGVDKKGAVQGCTTDATDDTVNSAELDAICNQDGKILKRSGGSWTCASGGSGSGDDLGNHVATQNLQLGPHWLSGDGGDEGIKIDTDGKVGINTAPGSANLVVGGVDGLLATGTRNSGVIPAEGAGTRLMWYPGKSAFRVGNVTGSQWNDANIGGFSLATGHGTIASAPYATAIGKDTTAGGSVSTALGNSTTASGIDSTAMGHRTTASQDYSTAMGYYTQASAGSSTALGASTTASGDISTAMGSGTTADGKGSTSMGWRTTAKSAYETAIGTNNTDYTANSSTDWHADDRLFVIGNGKAVLNPSDAMVVLKNGNTSIGNFNPEYRLQVEEGSGCSQGLGGTLVIGSTSGENLCLDTNEIMARKNGAELPLSIQHDGGLTQIGGTLLLGELGTSGGTDLCRNGSKILADCSSSARYKENIEDLPLGLAALDKLRPVSFDWKDGQGHDLGFVAEEVAAVNPVLATYRDGEVEGVKYKQLTALLVNGLKEQQGQIETQQKQIAALTLELREYRALAAEVASMKQSMELVVAGRD